MAVWVGTSGYNYPEWRGSFYPVGLPARQMLPYYADHFRTVEINSTFYRFPTKQLLDGWQASTPASFKLTLKAPGRITHQARLVGCEELVKALCGTANTLGAKLGVLLFQLPPSMKKNLEILDRFLDQLPTDTPAAFEFRNESWHGQEVFERLRLSNTALCIADSEKMSTPLVETADFGYLRLRDEGYGQSDLDRWAEVIRTRQPAWRETFVYFKHEEEGKGPVFAKGLIERLGL